MTFEKKLEKNNFDDIELLKSLINTIKAVSKLSGSLNKIPHPNILINTLSIREAKASNEIENIITTYHDIYLNDIEIESNISAKEVVNYQRSINVGLEAISMRGGITENVILKIHDAIYQNMGFRKQPGTIIKNTKTGEVIHTPPMPNEISSLISELNYFYYGNDTIEDIIKIIIYHHQFEFIHPFYDGNGRVGRILLQLQLIETNSINFPVLYVSKYINANKTLYYQTLSIASNDNNYIPYILFMLKALEQTAIETLQIVEQIVELRDIQKETIKLSLPKLYSKDLLEVILTHTYTTLEKYTSNISCSRQKGARDLQSLCEIGILEKRKLGTKNYYVNQNLFDIVTQ